MLYGWMKSLIIYLVLAGLVMNLAPGQNYKKYINFFSGLIVVIILSRPISYIFNLSSGDLSGFAENIENYMGGGQEPYSYDDIYNYYEMSLGESMRIELEARGYAVEDIRVVTDEENRILKCTVLIPHENAYTGDGDSDENVLQGMKNCISDVYNVEMDSIYVVRR